MGKLLELKNKIKIIDKIRDFYENEQGLLLERVENLKSEVDTVFNSRHLNIEKELENKKMQEENAVKLRYKAQIQELENKFNRNISEINGKIDELKKERTDAINENCSILNMLIENEGEIRQKFEELNISHSARASIKRSDIPLYSKDQVIEMLETTLDIESAVLNLSLKDIDIKFIDKNFWFPAGKLDGKISNKNMVDFVKFMNILGMVTAVALYSDFIITGLLGALGYFGFKNVNETHSIHQYRDWLYTIYEYKDDLRGNIESFYEKEYKEQIDDNEAKLTVLTKQFELNVRDIENKQKEELGKIDSEYCNMKEKKRQEVNADLEQELKKIKVNTSDKMKTIREIMLEFSKNLINEQKNLRAQFEELNHFSLDIVNDSTELNLKKIHLGVESTNSEVNYFYDLGFGSYLFIHNQDKMKLRNLMKYITCQFASRIKGNLLNINILDPLSYGEGLSEIVDEKSISQYYNESEVSDKIDEILDKFTRDIKDVFTGYDSILEYNKEKNSKGSKPYPYTLNLIQNVNLFDDMSRFKQLLQTRKSGVINFILISNDLIDEVGNGIKDSEVKKAEFLDIMDSFNRLFTCIGDNLVKTGSANLLEFYEEDETDVDRINELNENLIRDISDLLKDMASDTEKYKLTPLEFQKYDYNTIYLNGGSDNDVFESFWITAETFRNLGRQITDNIRRSQMLIFYFDDFIERVVPIGTEFTKPCVKGLELNFGYKDGDIEKPMSIPLDGETIHYFMGGRTGMGKSNTLNTGINTLIRNYSPDDLNIYYLDFKVIEGKKYMRNPTPHFKCISVTEDPYYLISLFDYLIKVLKNRQEVVLPSYNAGKLADIKKLGVKIPEILIVIDEYTEALKSDDDTRSAILQSSDTISRLGRASGVHLFYTSQDVSSKIPDGMLGQFAGRLSLPVSSPSTSKQIIMNASAADADFQEMGNLMFNNKGGDEKYNIKFKVPLIEPEDMDKNFEYVNDLCKDKWDLNCVMFDQDEDKPEEELSKFLESNKKVLKSTRKITVGGNAQFSTVDTPVGFDLYNEESNNILIISQGKKRRIELTNTVVKNFAKLYGNETALFILRGNKDYLDLNYAEKYKNEFKVVREFESITEILEMLKFSQLAVLERELKEFGIDYDKSSEYFEDLCKYDSFRETWEEVKTMTLDNNRNATSEKAKRSISKSLMSMVIESVRPYITRGLVLAEGIDEIYGIGIDPYKTLDEIPLLRYAPYYGIINIWNSSKTPRSFSGFEPIFRHRLIGSLDPMDAMTGEYKFMKGTKNSYGGYVNIINPSAPFKFKIFKLDNITDDEKADNRVIVGN